MSGHSKWHSIRRSKGVLDQRRGQLFTKLPVKFRLQHAKVVAMRI